MGVELNYDNIQQVAETFATQYRSKNEVPSLPDTELNTYRELFNKKYFEVKKLALTYTEQFDPEGGHGFEHLEWVSALAGFIAEHECKQRHITGERKDRLIETALLAGLLHDIDRHLGFGEDHMIKGAETAKRILSECNVENPLTLLVVRNHDHIDYDTGEDEDLEIVFGSVFDADHFRYGLEREDTFWRMKEKKGKSPSDVIHDYQFLPPYRDAWRSAYGKEVGPKFIDFGLAVAQHVEKSFSQ